jgi:predicted RNA-binding protein with TRAM domain
MGRKLNRQRKEANRRSGFGDDLFYDFNLSRNVRVGEVVNVTIGEMDQTGEGVVRLGGVKIRIPDSQIGDRLKIKIESVEGRTGEATVLDEL